MFVLVLFLDVGDLDLDLDWFQPGDVYKADMEIDLKKHWKFENFGDRFAFYLVKSLRLPTDIFFRVLQYPPSLFSNSRSAWR